MVITVPRLRHLEVGHLMRVNLRSYVILLLCFYEKLGNVLNALLS